MSTETVTEIDTQLITARWAWWHATWADDADELAATMATIDELLERRHALAATLAVATETPIEAIAA